MWARRGHDEKGRNERMKLCRSNPFKLLATKAFAVPHFLQFERHLNGWIFAVQMRSHAGGHGHENHAGTGTMMNGCERMEIARVGRP
jgi:hypothetical protein